MTRYKQSLIVFTLLIISVTSCKPDPIVVERDLINKWIWEGMSDLYYWYDDLDQNLYPSKMEPSDFFYEILNPIDRFSWIVDDYQELINSFQNIEVSNGISPYFIRVANSESVVVVVEYVAPYSPADDAGIKRGDIITDINGIEMTIHNYSELFYLETSTLVFANYVDGSLVSNGVEITLTAIVIDENPIHHYEIIDYEGTEIAYMVYNHFTSGTNDKWLQALDNQLAVIKTSGIQDLIIDIRYNPGGSIFMANHLASSLCPAEVPGNDNPFVYLEWNDIFHELLIEEEGEDSESLVTFFEEAPSTNLDLRSIYFLTSSHSASASELLIIGLDPFMNVEHIGEATYGKGYGSITIDDWEQPKRHEWAMQPITFKFTNALGGGVSMDGISPEYEVDDLLFKAKPFGDITDPQLAKALELITGVSPLARKSVPIEVQDIEYEILPDPVRELRNRAMLKVDPIKMPVVSSKLLY
jgi:carboxyl-terminal processing protease